MSTGAASQTRKPVRSPSHPPPSCFARWLSPAICDSRAMLSRTRTGTPSGSIATICCALGEAYDKPRRRRKAVGRARWQIFVAIARMDARWRSDHRLGISQAAADAIWAGCEDLSSFDPARHVGVSKNIVEAMKENVIAILSAIPVEYQTPDYEKAWDNEVRMGLNALWKHMAPLSAAGRQMPAQGALMVRLARAEIGSMAQPPQGSGAQPGGPGPGTAGRG